MRKFLLFICVCGCFAATSLFAQTISDTFAVNFASTAGSALGNGPFTEGWSFTVTAPGGINVTDLSVFDNGGAALVESHAVGIWNSAGTLVDSATVPSGTAGTLETDSVGEQWRDVSAPVFLADGTYTIGAVWLDGSDPMIFPGTLSSVTMGTGITFLQDEFIAGGTLTDPTNTTSQTGAYFGPNFEYTAAAAVPEPSSVVLLGTAALAVGLSRLRKARRKGN